MNTPEITDEEINGMMDFQHVLDSHRKEVATRSAKYWSAGIIGVIILSVVTYYSLRQTTTPTISQLPHPVKSQQPVPVAPADSAAKKIATETPAPAKSIPSQANEVRHVEVKPPALTPKADVYLPAEPVQGYPHLYKYFNDQLSYPKEAAKDSIQGVVSVTFIVRPTGVVDHITIVNSLGPLFDAEALRVMHGMPPWKPAQLNGKTVPSKMSVPLTFRIESTKK